ncbi:MAG: c-type cytochrome [Hyphomicrobium zavarzinii]|nr:c-type cytochrome [Hyphomicrobium zavarzinii]
MRRKRRLPLAVPICTSVLTILLVGHIWPNSASGGADDAVPLGLPPLEAHQRPVKAQVELGRKLFFDRRLAFNNTNSCAMCHIESQGLTSNQSARAIGMEGRSLSRNAPALYNVAYQDTLFHDGRESDLAQQAWAPLLSPLEMANPSIGHVVDKIRSFEDYRGLFEAVFDGHGPSMQTIGDALASYQRTLLSGNSRFDKWYYGKQDDALNADEKAGFEVFMGKGQCATCHTVGEKSALFTDHKFYVTGIGYYNAIGAGSRVAKVELAPGYFIDMKYEDMKSFSAPRINDIGRFAVTLDAKDRWAYKTPSLRNIELTYPYMHDGSLSTLEDVVAFYDKGGLEHDGERALQPLHLAEKEKADLVAFLRTLTTAEDQAKHEGYR